MATELLKTGKHTVTAISRADSTTKLPDGIKVKHIDYEKHETIVEALRGQDVLIITLSITAPKDTQEKLLKAAFEGEVPWTLPNDWSPDTADEGLIRDVPAFQEAPEIRQMIEADGRSSYISINTGFWYEWSLSIPTAFGINLVKREAILFDEGTTKISPSPHGHKSVVLSLHSSAFPSAPKAPEKALKATETRWCM